MLRKLKVKNVVLISLAEVEFSKGLNVLTGETGAGKSIVVDCLMLLFGVRYDKSLLRYGADEGYVEGVFSLSRKAASVMSELGLEIDSGFDDESDFAGTVIIKRRFTAEGKNDIKINGQSATAGMLKKLMASLVDIYGQHDFQKLYEPGSELAQIDYYARHKQRVLLEELTIKHQKYRKAVDLIKSLGDAGQREREIDFLNYQIAEINAAKIYESEEEELTSARRKALNHEKITDALRDTANVLTEANISHAVASLKKIEALGHDVSHYIDRLDSCQIELEDLNTSIMLDLKECQSGADDIENIEKRLSLIRSILRKYGDFDKMTEFLKESEQRLKVLVDGGELYEKLSLDKDTYLKEIYELSLKLSETRRATALEFVDKINAELHNLGMQNAELNANFADSPTFDDCEKHITPLGMDNMYFSLRTNKGQPFMPLLKIISGGEMSRFMLAVKAVNGDTDKIPTLIFDEIDSGISGKVGQEVAKKLAEIALNSQVLCVTHLPQIAAMADLHLMVKKDNDDANTVTHIERLSRAEMIKEVARLSGGIDISESSEKTAAEIKSWCDDFKKSLIKSSK